MSKLTVMRSWKVLRHKLGFLQRWCEMWQVTYNMQSFLESSVESYEKLAGLNYVCGYAATPLVDEDDRGNTSHAPCTGPGLVCPFCLCVRFPYFLIAFRRFRVPLQRLTNVLSLGLSC